MHIKFFGAAILAAALAVGGCASVPMAGKNADTQAKQFAPIANKAAVYIYRNEHLGMAIKLPLLVDGLAIGDTGPMTYFEIALSDGHHTITSKGEKDSELAISVQAGHTYYVWQEIKVGMFAASTQLHLVDEAKGKSAVLECEMVQTTAPGLRVTTDMTQVMAPANSEPAASTSPDAPVAAPVAAAKTSATTEATAVPSTEAPAPVAAGGPASLDDRVPLPMFRAAQDLASIRQCDRLIRVEAIDGDHGRFFSRCPANAPRLEIDCHGAQCVDATAASM